MIFFFFENNTVWFDGVFNLSYLMCFNVILSNSVHVMIQIVEVF